MSCEVHTPARATKFFDNSSLVLIRFDCMPEGAIKLVSLYVRINCIKATVPQRCRRQQCKRGYRTASFSVQTIYSAVRLDL